MPQLNKRKIFVSKYYRKDGKMVRSHHRFIHKKNKKRKNIYLKRNAEYNFKLNLKDENNEPALGLYNYSPYDVLREKSIIQVDPTSFFDKDGNFKTDYHKQIFDSVLLHEALHHFADKNKNDLNTNNEESLSYASSLASVKDIWNPMSDEDKIQKIDNYIKNANIEKEIFKSYNDPKNVKKISNQIKRLKNLKKKKEKQKLFKQNSTENKEKQYISHQIYDPATLIYFLDEIEKFDEDGDSDDEFVIYNDK